MSQELKNKPKKKSWRLYDIVVVNFFHQNNIIKHLKKNETISFSKDDFKIKDGKLFDGVYMKSRPAIILGKIHTNNGILVGYIVAPMTTKEKQELSWCRMPLVVTGMSPSFIKWDGIQTIAINEIVDIFISKEKRNGVHLNGTSKIVVYGEYKKFKSRLLKELMPDFRVTKLKKKISNEKKNLILS